MRLRFAPSPTGFLHVGGARTALYNWLLARSSGGSFILRIEDTDLTRSTEEATQAIIDDLKWLGLDWDEGPEVDGDHWPYRQTGRFALYHDAARRLLSEGKAYRCFCSPEEIEEKRKKSLQNRRNPMYDQRCLRLSEEDAVRREMEGEPFALRFRIPEGVTRIKDLIRGEIIFNNAEIGDYVLMRRDGTPTYNLAVVVDDIDMRISHVVRGDDHISNTPKQILLYEALGAEIPAFAHLSMIVGDDGKPLSKRHGDVAVGRFRELGFLPEAMINFMALLGWSLDDSTTIMDRDTLIENFSLERVSSRPAVWDADKLIWMNGQYIMAMGDEELARHVFPILVREGLVKEDYQDARHILERAAPLIRERMKQLNDALPMVSFLFREVEVEEESLKLLRGEDNKRIIKEAGKKLLELDEFEAEAIEAALRSMAEDLALKPRKAFQPVRVAITGSKVSPPLFESIELLGREHTMQRLAHALEIEQGSDEPAGGET